MAESKSSTRSDRFSVLGLAIAYIGLAWFGNATVAAWDAFQYPYNDRINFIDVFRDMLSLPLGDVFAAGTNQFGMPFLNTIMAASFVLAAIALLGKPASRGLLFAAAAIVVPYGLLGLLTFLAFATDGESLAEGWVLLQAFAVWSVILWSVAAKRLRQPAPSLLASPI